MKATGININFQYKDRLFRLLFGREEYKENVLDLYNALNDSDYKDVSELELFTIEDVIYIKMKNDVAFILDSYLSLWEQQSTDNPNMPVRGLMYFGKLYSKYIKSRKLNIYGTKQIMIPTPRYVVLYNGAKDAAVVSCINDGILTEFLSIHRSEVLDMCITEFDEKTFIEGIKEEGRKEGREEGQKEGMKKKEKDLVSKMLSNGKTPSSISDFCDIPLDYVLGVQTEMGLASPSDK